MKILLLAALWTTAAHAGEDRRPAPQLGMDKRLVPVEDFDLRLDDIGYRRDRVGLVLGTLRNGEIDSERPIYPRSEVRALRNAYRDGEVDCLIAAMPSLLPGTVNVATAGDCRPDSYKVHRRSGRALAAQGVVMGALGVGLVGLGVAFTNYTGEPAGVVAGAGLGALFGAGSALGFGVSFSHFRTAKRLKKGTF